MKKEIAKECKVGKNSIGYVSNDFKSRFYGQSFEPVKVAPRSLVLPREMNDKEIESELKPGFCTIGDVLSVITSKKKEYKDGNWNLFYFETCVVHVYWSASGGEWRVNAWERDDRRWLAGDRVFSPASGRVSSSTRPSDLTLESLSARLSKLESIFNPALLKLVK